MAFADNNDNTLNYAGDFRVTVCNIISYRRAPETEKAFRISVLPQLASFSFAEDITSPCVTGSIDLIDTTDIRTNLPITGIERLELEVFTPGQDKIQYLEDQTDTLYVYKTERVRQTSGTGRQQIYRLHFTSREAYKNNTTRVSRAYSGPVENAVINIVKDFKYLNTNKVIYAEPTSTNTKVVIPNLKPFAAIKYLASQAISQKYKNAGYLFYETTRGLNFRSIESLMAMDGSTARPVTERYAIQPSNIRDAQQNVDVAGNLQSVLNYSIVNPTNMLEQLGAGMFANRLVTHDIYNKKIETHDFDYHESFGDYFHTEHTDGEKTFTKWLYPFTFFDGLHKTMGDFPMQKLMHTCQTAKVHDNYELVPCKDTLPIITSQRAQMTQHNLVMTVHGQTRINAGQMISFNLPLQKALAHDEAQDINPYYSGRYLLLQVKHNFDIINQMHTMNIRAVKDSVNSELPIEVDDLITQPAPPVNDTVSVYEDDIREIGRG